MRDAWVAVPEAKKITLEERLAAPGWRDALACCCGDRFERVQLSDTELGVMRELRDHHCNEPFDPGSAETDKQLQTIWNSAYPKERIQNSENSPRWKRLGFQSSTPRTDVRAGRFALDQLHYLAATYPERLQQFAKEACDSGYPFAVSCFNVSHLVVVYFDLCSVETRGPVPDALPATRTELKHFVRLCSRSPDGPRLVMDELFCALVARLHDIWNFMRKEEDCNLLQFPRALKALFQEHERFWANPRDSVKELHRIAADKTKRPALDLGT